MAHPRNEPTRPRDRDAARDQSAPKPETPRRPEKSGANEEMELPEQNRKLGKRHD
jgi:hypothetical protein